ncbi:hypothetical protein [Vibrio parahaemolyticus]|uniref:hypothetical protein n=1 Tax=Vibrio parahaemolyticus TaxID=670 RepID=UPI0006C1B9BF|nr:hypothetical protein [Vibrio parahaemolyticus]KOY38052.1 hypothetical protein ACX10_12490 [Vibrio parahaemolyticus]
MKESTNSIYDAAKKMDNPGLILEEIVKSIEENRDVESFVKLAFNFALKNQESLSELLDKLKNHSLYSELTRSYIIDLIRRLSSTRYYKMNDDKCVDYLVMLPVIIKSHFGSHQENGVLPPIIRNNLSNKLEQFFAENGMTCAVKVDGSIFNYEDYQPGIFDYVEYEQYFKIIAKDEISVSGDKHELFMLPMRVSLKRDAENHFFDNGESFNRASTYEAFKSFQDDIRCLIQFVFKSSKYNVSVVNPMLANEALWGALSFVRIEKCLFDIAKQAIIARPSDYNVIVSSCEKTDKIRICFYVQNENFYAFDYGKPINMDHENQPRDLDIIQYFLSEYGFGVSLVEKNVEGSLTEELSRTLLRVT